jgi:ferritin-like metal-binding protein YciE
MSAKTLNDLFVEELRDIYDAEKQLTKALPKMAKAADSDELRAAFEEHLDMTRAHVQRCEESFKLMGIAARPKSCEGMQGLIEESEEAIEKLEGTVLDAALIASAQKAEHYEIAAYGTLATFAEVLDMQDVKDLLDQTLDEEKEADQKLTEIAESSINWEARQGKGQGEGEGEEEEEEEEEEGAMATAGSGSARGPSRGASHRKSQSGGSNRGPSSRSRKK